MLPQVNDDLINDFEEVVEPSKTYKLDLEKGQIVGFCDGEEAIRQAIYKILSTERYEYLIYSWNYGVEMKNLIGQPIPFVLSEIKRMITEALLQDDRIESVEFINVEMKKKTVLLEMQVNTVEGTLDIPWEVAA